MPADPAPTPHLAPTRHLTRAPRLLARAALRLAPIVLAMGCGEPTSNDTAGALGSPAVSPSSSSALSSTSIGRTAAPGEGPLVSFLGDSITAGLHLPEHESFPAVLAERLAADDRPIRYVNAGVSGDTTSGGLRRLEWQLRHSPDILVVELGANDALRGQDLASVERNLRSIVQRAQAADTLVLLLGMKIPPNYGLDYTLGFEQLYERIAEDEDVPLIPFFMEDVVLESGMMLSDGLHPTTAGHERLADTLMPELVTLLDKLEDTP